MNNYHCFGKEGPSERRETKSSDGDLIRAGSEDVSLPSPTNYNGPALPVDLEEMTHLAFGGEPAKPVNEPEKAKLAGMFDAARKKLRILLSSKPSEESKAKLIGPQSIVDADSKTLALRSPEAKPIGRITAVANGFVVHTISGADFGPRLTDPQREHLTENRKRLEIQDGSTPSD